MLMLADIVKLLRCPVCTDAMAGTERAVICARGHSYDIARQGYVALLSGAPPRVVGDTAEMIAARQRFLDAGHFTPIAAAVAEAVEADGPTPARLLEIGAGTGYYLRTVLDAVPPSVGVGIDLSKFAARRLARVHPRAAGIVADAWAGLPVRDGVVTHALSIFAPRNTHEIHRVLAPGGVLIVVTPTARHLGEIVEPLGMVRVDERKQRRLDEATAGRFALAGQAQIEYSMTLTRDDVAAVVAMGPSARHTTVEQRDRSIGVLPAELSVTASVLVSRYRRQESAQPRLATTSE